MTTELPAHSELGASGMDRWASCPGSVALSRGLPNLSSIYAAEGTAAHEVAAFCLRDGSSPYDQVGNVLKVEGFSIEVTNEMADAIMVYLTAVRDDFADSKLPPTRLVEHGFHLIQLHPKLHGTADCVQLYPAEGLLRVYDYKHGAGVAVSAHNNAQLKYYALGALLSTNMPANLVELVIVQPRCASIGGPVRRERIPAVELLEFSADLMEAVGRTEAINPELNAGEHCRWCRAAAICPQLQKTARETARVEFRPDVAYNSAALAQTLRWLPVLEGWIESTRKFAYAEALAGKVIPGHKLVDKRAVRKWQHDDHTTVIELARIGLTESDVYAPRELNSPAQIEKAIGKPKANADKFAFVAGLTIKASSGTALVPETDPRAEHKRDAAADFAERT